MLEGGILVFIVHLLFLIHGFKQQYPGMSLEWILDKPLALGLGPHPHLTSALSLSLSLRNTHMQGLQKHYWHSLPI